MGVNSYTFKDIKKGVEVKFWSGVDDFIEF